MKALILLLCLSQAALARPACSGAKHNSGGAHQSNAFNGARMNSGGNYYYRYGGGFSGGGQAAAVSGNASLIRRKGLPGYDEQAGFRQPTPFSPQATRRSGLPGYP